MVVLRLHPVRAQQSCPFRQPSVARREQSGVTERPEVLAPKEREAAEGPDGADRSRFVGRSDGLRGILDDGNAVPVGVLHDRIEIGAEAEQVHRQDGPRSRRDRRGERLRIDIEGDGVDVHEHRPRAEADDRACGGEERIRRRHHFVAGRDPEGHQRQQDRVGSGRYRNGVVDPEQGGQLVLERVDLRPHDEPLAVAHARDRRQRVLAQRSILRLKVEERYFHGGHSGF